MRAPDSKFGGPSSHVRSALCLLDQAGQRETRGPAHRHAAAGPQRAALRAARGASAALPALWRVEANRACERSLRSLAGGAHGIESRPVLKPVNLKGSGE